MKTKLILLTLLWSVFSFSNSAHAITITGTGTIGTFIIGKKEIPINKLKSHTVTVYQRNITNGKTTFLLSAGVSINERQVLTVFHGVSGMVHNPEGTVEIFVQQGSDMAYYASIVKYDETHDLALLDIGNAPNMLKDTLPLGDPEGALVTIGHPHGEKFTITTGKLGHIHRNDYLISLEMDVQTGNSGGGVMNDKGELVGIVQSALDQVGNTGFMVGKEDIQNFLK